MKITFVAPAKAKPGFFVAYSRFRRADIVSFGFPQQELMKYFSSPGTIFLQTHSTPDNQIAVSPLNCTGPNQPY